MGALCIGPRTGRFVNPQRAYRKRGYPLPGHSVPLVALGGFILIVDFLAFNGGSAIDMVENAPTVAAVFVNTLLSSSGGALTAVASELLHAKVRAALSSYIYFVS